MEPKPVDQGEQPVPNAEEQPAAAKPNENPATPVQHVPLASIKSESPPGSNGADKNPIDLTGTVRGTGRNRPITFSPMGMKNFTPVHHEFHLTLINESLLHLHHRVRYTFITEFVTPSSPS